MDLNRLFHKLRSKGYYYFEGNLSLGNTYFEFSENPGGRGRGFNISAERGKMGYSVKIYGEGGIPIKNLDDLSERGYTKL